MNLEPKLFQIATRESVLEELRLAKFEIGVANKTEAVVLSAPTGSGKTLIVTDVIERILNGDEVNAPDPDAVFLWLTDQPELNEQTRRKMLGTSTALGLSRLVTIDASFDQQYFTPGIVYFLNTQKLGRDKNLVERGDERNYTIWETITNTAKKTPTKFYLIIDEAHRGMNVSRGDEDQATTIVQKFIKGSAGEIPPIPLVLGISATPERFNKLLQGTNRVNRSVTVDPADVRASGLIKDFVRFRTPKKDAPSDLTLLRNAVDRWKAYAKQWELYCKAEHIPSVRPLLIVQVEDGDQERLTKTDLEEVIAEIESVTGSLPPEAYAHAFQEGSAVKIGSSRTIRYLAPSDITDDPSVQIVFFKTSLSTGWDCPRAEVMMSFRRAADATLIAQLVGRMVRTPLARRIDANEMLNSVTLVLPHYDAAELAKVVTRLKAADPDAMPPVEFEDDDEVEELHRATDKDDIFNMAAELKTYVLPSKARLPEIRRLMKLSRLLVNDDVDEHALDNAKKIIFDLMDTIFKELSGDTEFNAAIANMAKIEVEERVFEVGGDLGDVPEVAWTPSSDKDIDDRFAAAGRLIGEGLHKTYWRKQAEAVGNTRLAKCQTIALITRPQVIDRLQAEARKTLTAWFQKYDPVIRRLGDEQKQRYNDIRGAGREPMAMPFELPIAIETVADADAPTWMKHIYVNNKDQYAADFNDWETDGIREEIARLDVIGWFRNPSRKPYSFRIPYENEEGGISALYPDFIVFRQTEHGIVADIVDPHLTKLTDAAPKAKGLAVFVRDNPEAFSRVVIMRKKDGKMQSLDIKGDKVLEQMLTVKDNAHLGTIYDAFSK